MVPISWVSRGIVLISIYLMYEEYNFVTRLLGSSSLGVGGQYAKG